MAMEGPMEHHREPASEPTPASPTKTTSTSPQSVDEAMLSPVSKLELARKYAAVEQQKRIDSACARMVEAKKEQLLKRREIEARLEDHILTRAPQPHEDEDTQPRGGALSSIAMKIAGVFKSNQQDENDGLAANTEQQDGDEHSQSPTRRLLNAARHKLDVLAENDGALPATNYHLKQLGLVNEKVNIYAPVDEQQQQLRRRASALRCQESFKDCDVTDDADYDSAEDSDYVPDADDEDNADLESEEDDSEEEMDEDELRQFVQDPSELSRRLADLKRRKQIKRKQRAKMLLSKTSYYLTAFIVVVFAALLAVYLSEQQSGFCQRLITQTAEDGTERRAICHVVLRIQQVFDLVMYYATFQHMQ